MPSPNNTTNITPPRVPLIDERTGLISREWYRFFLNLFTLTGGGANVTSLTDLQLGPPAPQQEDLVDIIIDVEAAKIQPTEESANEQIAELAKQVEGLAATPIPALGTFAALQQANLPWTTFDTTPQSVPTDVGTLAWGSNSTLGLQATANVIYQLGESEYVYARASATITKGQLCYHTGAVGSSGVITVAPTPLALTDPNQIVGVAAESLALNGFGLIQISGTLRGFNTTGSSVGETWADGDPLYYNPSFVGSFTKNKPSAPSQKSYMGEVINAGSGGSGSIHIRIVPGSVLGGTDSNVQFGTLANGDLIQYDSALQYWKNVAPSSIVVGTATNLAGGATGSVPYQSAASTTAMLPIGTALQVLKVNAGATAPEWVSGAALTKVDDTNVTLTLGGTPATSLLAATSLTLGWTGTLATTRGGTGLSSFTANGVVYASSTSALATSSALTFDGATLGTTGALRVDGNATLGDASTDTVRINGVLGVGGAANTSYGISITSSALTGLGQIGVFSTPTITSAATTSGYGYYARVFTEAASFTVADVFGLRCVNALKGLGSTITNQYGIYVDDQTQGTNNYGIRALVSSGANKWNIYASGTAANYLAGGVNLGATTDPGAGNLSLTGNVIIATSGKGIDFSATAGTGTSELLADYEEGYFDPTLTCGTSGTITLNASENRLAYTKIGRVVYISGQFAISSVSSPVGTVTMNNLPFAVASLDERAESAIFNVILSNTTLNTPVFFGLINSAGGTTLLIRAKDNAGAINASPASLFAASDVWISGYYLAA